ncbi:AMP-binding protein, partial [Rhizobium ruizarguesonis]
LAVVCEGQRLTYRELNERANQVARFLLERGCAKNEIVGIMAEQISATGSNAIAVYGLDDEAQYASYERTNPDVPLLPDDLAYVLYTSGS